MELPTINIINLKKRTDRHESVIRQMNMEKAPYKIWEGIETTPAKIGISRSHKKIIQWAKDNALSFVVIAEDDLQFTGTGAYRYFIENMPIDFDLYLGGYYGGLPDEYNVMKKFNGTTLFICHSRYYDTFLSVNENINLDNALSMTEGKFVVCPKFVCKQAPGYSDNLKKEMNYDYLLKDKPIYP